MSTFQEFHGISLAANSFVENFVVEQLASDPVPLGPGRVWFNTTDKAFKHSTLDAGGAVVVRSFTTAEALAAAVLEIDGRLDTIETTYIKKDGSVAFTADHSAGGFKLTNLASPVDGTDATNKAYVDQKVGDLGSVFEYVGTIEGGVDEAGAFDVGTLTKKEAGDFYKVVVSGFVKLGAAGTPIAVKVGDGIVFNAEGGIDKVDNTNSEVQGTAAEIKVTGSTDTGFVVAIDTAFKTRVSTLESEAAAAQTATGLNADGTLASYTGTTYLNSATSIKAATVALDTAVKAEVDRAVGVEGALASLTTDAKGNLVAAINEVDLHADGAKAAADAAQAELDVAELAIGLNTDGTLAAYTGTTYLNAATTIKGATVALDTAVKAEVDRAVAVEGALASLTTDAKGNLVAAINEVDAHADATQAELDVTQTGAGLASSGAYVAQGAYDAEANANGAYYIGAATSLANADKILDAALKTESDRAIAAEGSLSSLTTAAKGNLVSAINEHDAEIGDLSTLTTTETGTLVGAINEVKALAGDGVNALKTAINNARTSYTSATAATVHNITHSLGSTLVDVCVWIDRGDGVWRNDMAGVSIVDANSVKVELTAARNVRVTIEKMDDYV